MNQIKALNLIAHSIAVGVISLSILFLLISLFLPVFFTADGGQFDGFGVLLIGWMAILYLSNGLGAIGWYANPLLVIAWLCLVIAKFRKGGLVVLIVSIGIALCSVLMVHKKVLVNEGGGTSEIVSTGIGFYIWLASFLICIIGYIATITIDHVIARHMDG